MALSVEANFEYFPEMVGESSNDEGDSAGAMDLSPQSKSLDRLQFPILSPIENQTTPGTHGHDTTNISPQIVGSFGPNPFCSPVEPVPLRMTPLSGAVEV